MSAREEMNEKVGQTVSLTVRAWLARPLDQAVSGVVLVVRYDSSVRLSPNSANTGDL
jgi:hypothetical protein